MTLKSVTELVSLGAAASALLAGLYMVWADLPYIASWVWLIGALPAFVMLFYDVVVALSRRQPGVDLLALLAIAGAFSLDEPLTGIVIALMLASGRSLESFAQRRAKKSMSALISNVPKTATLVVQGAITQVPLSDVKEGDQVLIRTGDTVPVDGTLTSDSALLDESALTGESRTIELQEGASISSGTLNVGVPFEIRAIATADKSTYAGIVRMVTAAQASKAPSMRIADRYAMWFVPLSLTIALLAWLISGEGTRALAVLVVATPCPLILAVPVAIVSAMSRCAKNGVLVKSAGALENLAKTKRLFFDKTGTLTTGQAELVSVKASYKESTRQILQLAASLDQVSAHVMASAIVRAAHQRQIILDKPDNVEEQGGAGIAGNLNGERIAVGSLDYIRHVAEVPDWAKRFLCDLVSEGGNAVFVARNNTVIGVLHMADRLRTETPRAVRLLKKSGVSRIMMLTGDHSEIAQSIGAAIGVDEVLSEQSPANKLAAIKAKRDGQITMMVGDGVNDAPALAAADVGVAMGARGAAASAEAADVVILVDRLDRLAEAIHIAQQARSIALQSVFVGMGLSLTAMLVAALGYLPPLYGAILQEVIDVAVVLNALRALRIPPLRKNRLQLNEAQSKLLQKQHQVLLPLLDELTVLAGELPVLSGEQMKSALIKLDSLIQKQLLPHERSDDKDIYPMLADIVGGDDPMAAMSRTHQEIFHISRKLHQRVSTFSADAKEQGIVRELQRLLYSLDAIIRLHFAQEEELFENLQ